MRDEFHKYSRKYGMMVLASYAPGDGAIAFNWMSENDRQGAVLGEPVTHSDVSEWMRLSENEFRFKDWEIVTMGINAPKGVPLDIRIAQIIERPFHTSVKLKMDGETYDYIYHGPEDERRHYQSGNTDFYVLTQSGRKPALKVENLNIILGLCFFLNHEEECKASWAQV